MVTCEKRAKRLCSLRGRALMQQAPQHSGRELSMMMMMRVQPAPPPTSELVLLLALTAKKAQSLVRVSSTKKRSSSSSYISSPLGPELSAAQRSTLRGFKALPSSGAW